MCKRHVIQFWFGIMASRFTVGFVVFTGAGSVYRSLQRCVQSSQRISLLGRRSSIKKARLVLILTTVLLRLLTMRMPREVWSLERSTN